MSTDLELDPTHGLATRDGTTGGTDTSSGPREEMRDASWRSFGERRGSDATSSSAGATPRLPLDRTLHTRLRREFFARGHELAARYGVTADDLLAHLERANLAGTAGPARALSFIDDIIAACACVRGHPRAWHDAWSKHEAVLLRAARSRLDETAAVVFTRRYWIDLHAATLDPLAPRFGDDLPALPSVAEYVGVRPLRIWLTDRLLGRIENDARRQATRIAISGGDAPRSVRVEAGHLGGRTGRLGPALAPGFERRLRLVD